MLPNMKLYPGQDGGIGRHSWPPCTIIRRITANLKTKNTQNCQKFKLYGSLTTKDLKKPYSSRRVRGAEAGSWSEEDVSGSGETAVVVSGTGSPTFTTFTCGG